MLKEFQEFISKGNVMDLAVGVIIGGAFGLIVNSLVGDIIMPIIGAIFGGFDFSNYFLPLSSNVNATSLVEAKKQGAVFAYGNFLTVVHQFPDPGLDHLPDGQGGEHDAPAAGEGEARRASRPAAGRCRAAHRNPRPARQEIAGSGNALDQNPGRFRPGLFRFRRP